MNRIYILCIDDEPEILEALQRDLSDFEDRFPTEFASSAAEAKSLIESIHEKGDCVGLAICDHMMPGQLGVDFLIELNADPKTAPIRKTLITGQAGLDATIEAVNQAALKHYLAKPWKRDELLEMVRAELAEFILRSSIEPLPYYALLKDERLLTAACDRGEIMDS